MSPSKELKTLFVLSAHGSKSQKAKLQDCLLLFETLFEKNDNINNQLAEIKQDMKPHDYSGLFDFDSFIFDFPRESHFLNIFGNRMSVLSMLNVEQAELKKIGYEKWWIFDIWRGNLAKVVNEQLVQSQMNDLLFGLFQLSIANSPNKKVLDSFIKQLSTKEASSESVHKSVMYTLCSFDLERALEIYMDHNMYQYALCLAQLRLPPKNQIILDILNKYASYAAYTGDYETAALSYIRLADFENAYKCLLRRNYKNDTEAEHAKESLFEKFSKYIFK